MFVELTTAVSTTPASILDGGIPKAVVGFVVERRRPHIPDRAYVVVHASILTLGWSAASRIAAAAVPTPLRQVDVVRHGRAGRHRDRRGAVTG